MSSKPNAYYITEFLGFMIFVIVLGTFAATCCTDRYPWETRHASPVSIQQ